MLNTCQKYAIDHNLQFSTDINPKKSKTKCMAFLSKERELVKIKLNNNDLPWEPEAVHLGNTFENKLNGMKADINRKRAKYVQRNIELNQEFGFATPKTKCQININKVSH